MIVKEIFVVAALVVLVGTSASRADETFQNVQFLETRQNDVV